MIVEILVNMVSTVIKVLFSWINLPDVPDVAREAISNYLDLIFDNLDFLNFFVNPNTLSTIATIAILLYTFSRLYRVTIWIYHKLPISSN